MKNKYQILSPDNITIHHEQPHFPSLKKAKAYLSQWVNNYKQQGYYSQVCYNGYRRQISLAELPDYCTIINLNEC